jgi:hypothetical protein
MGSRKKAVKAFFDAVCCDDTMLDRWIPDEDWVRQIRENGDNGCSTMNLNNGLSAQCMWQNNHATLQGETIFYNKKSEPPRQKQQPTKPAPTVSSDQGFYQSLWDDLDKQKAPQAKKVSTTPPPTKKAKAYRLGTAPTKKAKASSTRPISPEPPTKCPLSPSPPESFQEAN